jgi:hypothetical protein
MYARQFVVAALLVVTTAGCSAHRTCRTCAVDPSDPIWNSPSLANDPRNPLQAARSLAGTIGPDTMREYTGSSTGLGANGEALPVVAPPVTEEELDERLDLLRGEMEEEQWLSQQMDRDHAYDEELLRMELHSR